MATRRTPPRRRPRDDNPGARAVLIGGGVLVVAGLGLGMAMGTHKGGAHGATPGSLLANATATATPHIYATPTPHIRPHATPSPVVHATHSPVPTPTPSSSPTPSASPTSSAVPTATASSLAQTTPHPRFSRFPITEAMLGTHPAAATATEPPAPEPTATHWHPRTHWTPHPHGIHPSATVTLSPRILATSTPAPVVVAPTNPGSVQTRRAESVVRHYLSALQRGDEPTAYHYLGGAPGDSGLSLSEETFMDHSMHVTSVAGQPDGTGQNVQVEIDAKHGLYVATYHVETKNGRQIITTHDFFKP
jgi:hypothetical protein